MYFLCNYGIASMKLCSEFWIVDLILLLMTLFVVCGFSRTIRACGHLLLLFMMIILLFVFSCRTLM
jgi:hypothetical protein